MSWLKEDTYFAQTGSGGFLLSYEVVMRLDETVPRDVVDSVSTETPAIWTNPAGLAFLSPDRLVHALTSLGYTPSVFALDHDQAVHEAFPYVLRVILGQEHRART